MEKGSCGVAEIRLRRAELTRNLPEFELPFWGSRTIAMVPPKAVVPHLNESPLLVPAPEQGGRALHRRFLPRCFRRAARRDRAPGSNDGPARLRGRA